MYIISVSSLAQGSNCLRSSLLGYLLLLVMGTGRGKGEGPHSKGGRTSIDKGRGKSFSSWARWYVNASSESWVCQECGKVFMEEQSRERHWLAKHGHPATASATPLSIPPPPPFPEELSASPQAFSPAVAVTEGKPGRLDALLANLLQQHPQIAQDIGKCAANSLKFKYLQASAGVNKGDIQKIWHELPFQEQQELVHAFELGDGARNDWFLAVVEEETLQRRKVGEEELREAPMLNDRAVTYAEMCRELNDQRLGEAQLQAYWVTLKPVSIAKNSMSAGVQASGMDNEAKMSTSLRLAILCRWPRSVGQAGHCVRDVRCSEEFQMYFDVPISMWDNEVLKLVREGYMLCTGCLPGPDSEKPTENSSSQYILLHELVDDRRRLNFLNRTPPHSDTSKDAMQRRRFAWSCFLAFQEDGDVRPCSYLTVDEMKEAMVALDYVMTWEELRAAVNEVSAYEGNISFSTFEIMISDIEFIPTCKLADLSQKQVSEFNKPCTSDVKKGPFWSYRNKWQLLVIDGGVTLAESAAVAVKIPETSWLADVRLAEERVSLENTFQKMRQCECVEWHEDDMAVLYARLLDFETAQQMIVNFTELVVFRRRERKTLANNTAPCHWPITTSVWVELSEELAEQLANLTLKGAVVWNELLNHKHSRMGVTIWTTRKDSTVTTAVFHHLLKWNVVACEQGRCAPNEGRHYAIFGSKEDAMNAFQAIGQQGKFTANWPEWPISYQI